MDIGKSGSRDGPSDRWTPPSRITHRDSVLPFGADAGRVREGRARRACAAASFSSAIPVSVVPAFLFFSIPPAIVPERSC